MREIEDYYDGTTYRVKFIRKTRADVDSELDKLEQLDNNEARKVIALLQRCGDHGPPRNEEKCRSTSYRGLYELKTTRVRIPFFWHAGAICLTHLFFKGTKKEQDGELRYAHDLLTECKDPTP